MQGLHDAFSRLRGRLTSLVRPRVPDAAVEGFRFLSPRLDLRSPAEQVMEVGSGSVFRFATPSDFDHYTVREVFSEKAYSLDGMARKEGLLRCLGSILGEAVPVIVDCGANLGASSVLFSRLYKGSRVLAVEPDPRNIALFRQNACHPGITLFEGAVGARDGTLNFSRSSNPRAGTVGAGDGLPVRIFSVPSLLASVPGGRPFILKVDIEGFEAELFDGECPWVDDFPVIVIEPHDWMFPGKMTIRNFIGKVAALDRDLLVLGENLVSVSNRLVP